MASQTAGSPSRGRLRDVVPGVFLGDYAPGPKNSITDVPGVLASTMSIRTTMSSPQPDAPPNPNNVNTGVTVVLPRADWVTKACHAGLFRFNGAGEMTGSHWIAETGLLLSPIVLTSTVAVGTAYTGVQQHALARHGSPELGLEWGVLPVVAETHDGHLSDHTHFAVTPGHVADLIGRATADPVPEGNTGGGTGMMCQGFKGGTGSASRVVLGFDDDAGEGDGDGATERLYTVAALVQANYGRMKHLRIAGVPVGRIIHDETRQADDAEARAKLDAYDAVKDAKDGSIIVVLATDAPLHPLQLQRLAKRATSGLSRVGGYGHHLSGDIFLAFSTGNELPGQAMAGQAVDSFRPRPMGIRSVDDQTVNGLLEAAADATEEAIYNALCMAETMTGHWGHKVEALPLDRLKEIMARYK